MSIDGVPLKATLEHLKPCLLCIESREGVIYNHGLRLADPINDEKQDDNNDDHLNNWHLYIKMMSQIVNHTFSCIELLEFNSFTFATNAFFYKKTKVPLQKIHII